MQQQCQDKSLQRVLESLHTGTLGNIKPHAHRLDLVSSLFSFSFRPATSPCLSLSAFHFSGQATLVNFFSHAAHTCRAESECERVALHSED